MKKTRAVIYIRYSSHKQKESFSIEYQVDECTKFIETKDYELVGTYIDEAKTGKKVAGRDAFDQMLFDASQDKFDKIIVFSFSRSFRNTREALNCNHDLYEKYGIVIQSVIEPIDMTNPHGKFSGTNLFAMHELQSDITAAHVRSGMHVAAQQGYYLGGHVPFGYEVYGTGEMSRGKERRKYRVNEAEAVFVKEMFSLYSEGFSVGYIQKLMKTKGVKGRRGNVISVETIWRILKNEFYVGIREFDIKGYDKLKMKDTTPAIIDEETWELVQARRKSKQSVRPRKTRRIYPLTGKLICANCGGHLHGSYHGHKDKYEYSYYQCANRKSRGICTSKLVRKEHLDTYCLAQIKKHILNEEAMRSISTQIANAADNSTDEMQAEFSKAARRKDKIIGILKDIKKDVYEGEITKEEGQALEAEYRHELTELENALISLKTALQSAITPEVVYDYLQELLTLSNADNDEIIKVLFAKLIEKIVVHDDKIEVHLIVFPFAHFGDCVAQGQPYARFSPITTRKNLKRI